MKHKHSLTSLGKSIDNKANTKEGWRRLKRRIGLWVLKTCSPNSFSKHIFAVCNGWYRWHIILLYKMWFRHLQVMSLRAFSSIVYWQDLYLAMKMGWRAVTQSLEVTYTNCRASPSAGGCLGMSDMYGCFYFWRSQTLDKAMSPRMVNWHLPATGPHTEKPRTRYVLLVHGKIKGKSWRYSQLFGNNTKCSCFRDVCFLESQIKAGTNSKCPFYSVRCTRSKRYPCVNCTRKRYPCGHHKMQYQAHGARKDDNSQSLSFLVEVFDSQTTFSLFFFQLTGDQTRFLNWLFWQNLLEQIGLFTIAINYYSEVNTARSMDHFHGAVGTSL